MWDDVELIASYWTLAGGAEPHTDHEYSLFDFKDLVEDTVNHRRLCGEGEFDVPGFLEHVWKAGYRGPVGIEALNKELRTRPLDELATRSFNTTMAQFRH